MRRGAAVIALALAPLLAGAPAAATQQEGASAELARSVAGDPALESRATRLASELRCPVCQGLSIEDSPSPLALQMKDLIRTQVGQGMTDDEIRGYFVDRYGEWVLLEPRATGFNLLVYLLPAAALAAGLVLLFVAVRRWTSGAPDGASPAGDARA